MSVSKILENLITDSRTWDTTLENNKDRFLIEFDSELINELNKKMAKILDNNTDNFPLLKKKILKLKDEILLNGCGFFVINGSIFHTFSKKEKILIFTIISKILGELLPQNKTKDLLVEIKDIGKSMASGGRYHQTNESGSFHTDGSHIYSNPPDYIGLVCINQAKNGGESKFVSAYTVHNKMLDKNKELLKILYEKFYHDRKGEQSIDETLARYEPVFEFKQNKLNFKYQRELLNTGHEKLNKPFTLAQKSALDFLDSILMDENLVVSYRLERGDMMFSNNNWLTHDRNSFEDYEDDNLKRILVRTWIRDNDN